MPALTSVSLNVSYPRYAIEVVVTAAKLDHLLQKLLLTQMPGISNILKDKIFDYPGSLSSFSAKIDSVDHFTLSPQPSHHRARGD